MLVTYLGPLDAVDILGHAVGVKIGDTVDVPADLAGRPPSARYLEAHAEMIAASAGVPDHYRIRALQRELTGYVDDNGVEVPPLDPGEGLLAQTSAWAPATTKKSTSKAAAGGEEAQP